MPTSQCQTTVDIIPACSISSSILGNNLTLTWATTGVPTSASIDNGIGSVDPLGGSVTIPAAGTKHALYPDRL